MQTRRGSVYALVLGATAIVTAVGLGAVLTARINARTLSWTQEAADARAAGAAALELALHAIKADPDWRTAVTNGKFISGEVNGGAFTVYATAPDGSALSTDGSTQALLRVEVTSGPATQVMQLLLEPRVVPLDCLEAAIVAGDDIIVAAGDTLKANGIVAANDTISVNSALLNPSKLDAPAQAGTACNGSTYTSTKTTGLTRELPAITDLLSWATRATSIPLPGSRKVEKGILAPGYNSIGGGTNAQGIYKLDCGGTQVFIQNIRVHGTLILINPGSGSVIRNGIHWTTPSPDQPALIVYGNIALSYTNLDEDNASTNYNPSGAPYIGVHDNDKNDTYAGLILGVVYVHGDLTISSDIRGAGMWMASGDITCNEDLDFTWSNMYLDLPPPGFFEYTATPSEKGWSSGSN